MAKKVPAGTGTVRRTRGGYQIRFERFLPHPVAKVWTALTEADALAEWLAPGAIELAPGGRVRLAFTSVDHVVAGRVVAIEPPCLLAYTWGRDHGSVHWELFPAEGGTCLELTHTFPAVDEAANFLAGWHSHLELLALVLAGRPTPWPWVRWHELRDRYAGEEAGARS